MRFLEASLARQCSPTQSFGMRCSLRSRGSATSTKTKKHDLALESITKQVKSLGARSSSLMLVAEVWCGLKSRFDKWAEEVGESFLQDRDHIVKPLCDDFANFAEQCLAEQAAASRRAMEAALAIVDEHRVNKVHIAHHFYMFSFLILVGAFSSSLQCDVTCRFVYVRSSATIHTSWAGPTRAQGSVLDVAKSELFQQKIVELKACLQLGSRTDLSKLMSKPRQAQMEHQANQRDRLKSFLCDLCANIDGAAKGDSLRAFRALASWMLTDLVAFKKDYARLFAASLDDVEVATHSWSQCVQSYGDDVSLHLAKQLELSFEKHAGVFSVVEPRLKKPSSAFFKTTPLMHKTLRQPHCDSATLKREMQQFSEQYQALSDWSHLNGEAKPIEERLKTHKVSDVSYLCAVPCFYDIFSAANLAAAEVKSSCTASALVERAAPHMQAWDSVAVEIKEVLMGRLSEPYKKTARDILDASDQLRSDVSACVRKVLTDSIKTAGDALGKADDPDFPARLEAATNIDGGYKAWEAGVGHELNDPRVGAVLAALGCDRSRLGHRCRYFPRLRCQCQGPARSLYRSREGSERAHGLGAPRPEVLRCARQQRNQDFNDFNSAQGVPSGDHASAASQSSKRASRKEVVGCLDVASMLAARTRRHHSACGQVCVGLQMRISGIGFM